MRLQAISVCRCDATNTPTTSTTSTTSTTTTSTTTIVVGVGVFNDSNNFIDSIRVNGITVSGLVFPIGPGDTQNGTVLEGPVNGTIEVDIDFDAAGESISAFTATNVQECQNVTASTTYIFSPMDTRSAGNTIFVSGSFLPCSTTTTTTTSTTSSTTTSTTTAAILIQINNATSAEVITNITVAGVTLSGTVFPVGPGVLTSGFAAPNPSAAVVITFQSLIFSGSLEVTDSNGAIQCQPAAGSDQFTFAGVVVSSAGTPTIVPSDFAC